MHNDLEWVSSRTTIFEKVAMPVAFAALGAAFGYNLFVRSGPQGPAPAAVTLWAAASLLCAVWLWKWCIGLKKVGLGSSYLLCSNYLTEIEVSLSDVEAVEFAHVNRRQRAILRLRGETPFGRRILFAPRIPWIPFARDPALERLEAAIAAANGGKRSTLRPPSF
jgi:hypothetical protein